ncbi:MAG: hypothetical protein ACLSGF_00090 [Alistipes onderdonkii]
MKKLLLICLAAFAAASCTQEKQQSKPLYMWFDCEGNYATLSHPDSIRYYVSKIHDMGFTDVVVDVKVDHGRNALQERYCALHGRMGRRDPS